MQCKQYRKVSFLSRYWILNLKPFTLKCSRKQYSRSFKSLVAASTSANATPNRYSCTNQLSSHFRHQFYHLASWRFVHLFATIICLKCLLFSLASGYFFNYVKPFSNGFIGHIHRSGRITKMINN